MFSSSNSTTDFFYWPVALLVILGGLVVVLILIADLPTSRPSTEPSPDARRRYVGQEACQTCHPQQTRRWSGSHHDLAMQVATDTAVRAAFDSITVRAAGESAFLFRTDTSYHVRTEGLEGAKETYPVRYTFGVTPLQQYLVETSGGRFQTLNFSWDANNKQWFHLYPDETLAPGDPLHWTGRLRTWNTTCANCHSTNLQKNYDPESDTYSTTWSDIDVSCEACHGPGSRHVAWARSENREKDGVENRNESSEDVPETNGRYEHAGDGEGAYGLTVDLDTANSEAEIQTCARCHSRRQKISKEYQPGDELLDHYVPQLLREGLYHPDGQIDDEVYVYGSFLQSEMYQQGVQCADCHEPHSLELRREGNALCTQCHTSSTYDTADHHFHPEGSSGATCANCHMPEKTYMQIDARRDHSIRVPRPDLSVELGTPNACTRCHTNRSDQWTAQIAEEWYGDLGSDSVHYGEVFAAARAREPAGATPLIRTAQDTARSPIVRATALSLMGRYTGNGIVPILRDGLEASSPLMRRAAVSGVQQLAPSRRVSLLSPLLRDSVRAVRIEAARALAAVEETIPRNRREAFEEAFQEYEHALRVTGERPQSQLQIGQSYQERDQRQKARGAYQTALQRDSSFVPALVQLARLNNQEGLNDRAESLLRRALSLQPKNGEVHYMLGLLLAESKGPEGAVSHLETAARLLPERPRVQYNYGLALQQLGQPEKAEAALRRAHDLRPQVPDFLYALAVLYIQQNEWSEARPYAKELARQQPRSRRVQRLLQRVQQRTGDETGPGP